MIKNMIISIRPSLKAITSDKLNLTLALIPFLTGLIIYFMLGSLVFTYFDSNLSELIKTKFTSETFGPVVYWLLKGLFSILLLIIVNYTFVLFVSILAAPLSDLLSMRVEKFYKKEKNLTTNESLKMISSNLFSTLFNEIKKIIVIVSCSLLAIALSFFPLFALPALILNALIFSAGFSDYIWSRRNLRLSSCFKDIKNHFIGHFIMGVAFLFIVSIPFLGLIVTPLATSYYTIFWIVNNEYSDQAS